VLTWRVPIDDGADLCFNVNLFHVPSEQVAALAARRDARRAGLATLVSWAEVAAVLSGGVVRRGADERLAYLGGVRPALGGS
jgi:hypothetical protein